MKATRIIMGMPITLNIVDPIVIQADLEKIFSYFTSIDEKYSPFKKDNELAKINAGILPLSQAKPEMQAIFALCSQTKTLTHGYFDIYHQGKYDPSGLVKGWAINNAAKLLKKSGFQNFYVDAGGDIQVSGLNAAGHPWKLGVRNPFNRFQNVKTFSFTNGGVATSGTAIRGQHIYSPHNPSPITDILSLTVTGPNIYEADRFATAAFAMGKRGLDFIASLPGFSGFMIDKNEKTSSTPNFPD